MRNFVIGYKNNDPSDFRNFDINRYKKLGLKFKYYNKDIHRACFALPEFVKN